MSYATWSKQNHCQQKLENVLCNLEQTESLVKNVYPQIQKSVKMLSHWEFFQSNLKCTINCKVTLRITTELFILGAYARSVHVNGSVTQKCCTLKGRNLKFNTIFQIITNVNLHLSLLLHSESYDCF